PVKKKRISNRLENFLNGKTPVPMGDLQLLLRKERARADRTGLSFSQILLECDEVSDTLADNLMRTLYNRVRLTDEIRWAGNRTIAIVMPDTSSEGARALANSILDLLDPSENAFTQRQKENRTGGQDK
ncbi:MAG: hypothetical protein ACE5I1_09200, partial [bacterium]